MDIQVAALKTLESIIISDLNKTSKWETIKTESLGYENTVNVLADIVNQNVVGEKAHRWLGWAQAACVNAGVGTLEDMKNINRNT